MRKKTSKLWIFCISISFIIVSLIIGQFIEYNEELLGIIFVLALINIPFALLLKSRIKYNKKIDKAIDNIANLNKNEEKEKTAD